MSRFLFLVLVVLFALQACKKESFTVTRDLSAPSDTIVLGSFLPAYPGSWWQMANQYTGDTVTVTAGEWMLHHYHDSFSSNTPDRHVASYDGLPLYRYSQPKLVESFHMVYALHPLLKDSVPVGTTWFFDDDGPYGYQNEIIKMHDTLLSNAVIYPDVIGVKRYYTMPSGGTYNMTLSYYAKDIGLVRKVVYNTASDTIIEISTLVDYLINH